MGRGSAPHLPALPQRRARDFAHGAGTLVYQVLLSHGFDNSAPLTRHHHYAAIEAAKDGPALEPA